MRNKGFATRTRSTCVPADELEPCLRGDTCLTPALTPLHSATLIPPPPPPPSCVPGQFPRSSHDAIVFEVRRKKQSTWMGKCVLCLLVHAVFILCAFFAFLIGHWFSEAHTVNETDTSARLRTPASSILTASSPANTFTPTTHFSTQVPGINHATPQLRNVSISKVYPPDEYDERGLSAHNPMNLRSDERIVPLPTTVVPVHYDLVLDLSKFDSAQYIEGNVSIHLESFGNSTDDEIIFHASSNIFIQRLNLVQNGRPLEVSSVKRQFHRDLVRLSLAEPLRQSRYVLEIEFRTRVCQSENEGTHCIHDVVLNPDNTTLTRVLAGFVTKFEPTYARGFLPCWDEPRIKSTFNITVQHPANITALANTAAWNLTVAPMSRGDGDAYLITKYETTPPMPVYLLAFAVGPLTSLEMRTARDLPLTIWFPSESVSAVQYVATFSPSMFDQVESELEVAYPMSKLDLVVVNNFPVGGMENWGLIVFQSDALLTSTSSVEAQNMTVDRIAEQYNTEKLVTHEIVHQWFGNLVTPVDWSELWLSEGFTSYFVYEFLHQRYPHLTDSEYYMRLIQLVSKQSTTEKSALIREVERFSDIEAMFDGLHVYTKGAVIVKLIKDLIGPTEFRTGVLRFLKEHAFKSVSSDMLWSSLSKYADHGADKDILLADIMRSWLENPGIPEVIVSRSYEDQTIRVTQRASDGNRYVIYTSEENYPSSKHHPDARVHRRSASGARSFLHTDATKSPATIFDDSLPTTPRTGTAGTAASSRRRMKHRSGKLRKRKHRRKNAEVQATRGSKGLNKRGFSVFGDFIQHNESSEVIPRQPVPSKKGLHLAPQVLPTGERRRRMEAQGMPLLWSIPFSYSFGAVRSTEGQTLRQFWLHNETIRFVDNGLSSHEYMLVNPHWVYPYKVNYDLDNWRLLIDQLHRDHEEIPMLSRMQLLVDGETYLKQSAVPQLYIRLLCYLIKESEMGILLVGLDAVHSLIDTFSGTSIVSAMLAHFTPVIQRVDWALMNTGEDPELAATWLLSPRRLLDLYQLRCAAKLESCERQQQVANWLAFPTALDSEHHQQISAICHHLFTDGKPSEVALLMGLLKQKSTQWSVTLQLATCVRDDTLIAYAVEKTMRSRNAITYASVIQNSYSLQYNYKFREAFWQGLSDLSLYERQILLAVNTGKSDKIARVLLHAVRSSEELALVERLLPTWPDHLRVHLEYLYRKLHWLENTATNQISNYIQGEGR